MGVNGQAKLFETFSCSQQRDHHASLAANRSYVHDLNIAHITPQSHPSLAARMTVSQHWITVVRRAGAR
jgi:hypothetical protein